jgi:hypothetical protein
LNCLRTESAFGEKRNQGLHAAGGALSQGASLLGGSLPGGAIFPQQFRALVIYQVAQVEVLLQPYAKTGKKAWEINEGTV